MPSEETVFPKEKISHHLLEVLSGIQPIRIQLDPVNANTTTQAQDDHVSA